MSEKTKDDTAERRLIDIVREVKVAAAEKSDVVIDMRDADRARLELLADQLESVIDDVDPADDRFDFGISPGQQPRFWIDAVAHVHMGPDRRVYRFVRDTRLGRVVMEETPIVGVVAEAVANYVAERIIERERMLAGDFEPVTLRRRYDTDEAGETADRPISHAGAEPGTTPKTRAVPERQPGRGAGFVIGASWFILGCVAGAAGLIVALWDRLAAAFG